MLWVLKKTRLNEHPKQMCKMMDKKIISILRKLILLNWPYELRQLKCCLMQINFRKQSTSVDQDQTAPVEADCSCRSSLIWVYPDGFREFLNKSADKIADDHHQQEKSLKPLSQNA